MSWYVLVCAITDCFILLYCVHVCTCMYMYVHVCTVCTCICTCIIYIQYNTYNIILYHITYNVDFMVQNYLKYVPTVCIYLSQTAVFFMVRRTTLVVSLSTHVLCACFRTHTGECKFAVASDDASEVCLSSDHQPANLKKVSCLRCID